MKFVLKFYADETYYGGMTTGEFDRRAFWVDIQDAMIFDLDIENGKAIVKPDLPDLSVYPVAITIQVK